MKTTIPKRSRVGAMVAMAGGIDALAAALGVSRRSVSRWGTGVSKPSGLARDAANAWARKHGLTLPFALLATLLALVSLAGCAPLHPTHYTIYLDPSLGHEATPVVVAALDAWEAATRVAFDVRMQHIGAIGDGEIAVYGANDAEIAIQCPHFHSIDCSHTDFLPGDSRSSVYLNVMPASRQYLWHAARHEVGHALGLQHDAPGTIMCTSQDCQADEITPADVAQYWAVRR